MTEDINLDNVNINLMSQMAARQSSSFGSRSEILNPALIYPFARSKQKNGRSDQLEKISLLTLHQAARDGQFNMVKEYLTSYGKDKKKINAKDAEEASALHYAVRYGHFSIVKLLVENGANVNIKGECGATPLHYAARYIVERRKSLQYNNEPSSLTSLTNNFAKPSRSFMSFGKADIKKSLTKSIKTYKKKNQLLSRRKTIHCSLEGINKFFRKKPQLNELSNDSCDNENKTRSNFDMIDSINPEKSFQYGYEDNDIESESKRPVVIIGKLSTEELVDMKSVDALILPALKNVSTSDPMIESLLINEKFSEYHRKSCGTINEFTEFLKDKFIKKKTAGLERKRCNKTVEDSILKYLLEQKAFVNAKDIYGLTPLHYAAIRSNIIATKLLLNERNIEIDAIDRRKMTSLHCAASAGSFSVCRLLLDGGADIFCQGEDDMTPLHLASMEGHLDIVMLLFDYAEKQGGVTMLAKLIFSYDRDEQTALHLAVENNHTAIVEFFINKGANVNLMKANMTSPLHLACTSGLIEIAKLLVENGADIESKNSLQETPLHRAALFNRVEIIQYLLSKGACIDIKDKDNETPLLMAMRKNNWETVKLLLDNSADLTLKDANDKTCLYIGAEENSKESLEILCQHDIKMLLEEFDKHELTPLHIAAKEGHENIVQILLNLGACIDSKNDENLTPLHLASKHGHYRVVELLLSTNLSIVNDVDDASNTPLHLAAMEGHVKVVEILIKSGAAVDARNASLWTPLDCSAFRGWKHCAEFLLDADSVINPLDKFKITPLHLASKEGHVELVKLLLSRNADISRKDHMGKNCLDYAIDNNQREVAIAILSNENWKVAMRNLTFEGNKLTTPMRKLIKKLPDVAEIVFNNCIVDNGLPDEHPQFKLIYTYEFLEDNFTSWGSNSIEFIENQRQNIKSLGAPAFKSSFSKCLAEKINLPDYYIKNMEIKQNHPLKYMVQNERTRLLSHPLVTYLLRRKWNSSGRYVYYTRLFIYIIFLMFVTFYALSVHDDCKKNCDWKVNYNVKSCTNTSNTVPRLYPRFFIESGRYFIVVLSGISLFIELIKLVSEAYHYIQVHRSLELAVYISALIFVLKSFRWEKKGYEESCSELYRGFGAALVTLSWLVLVLFLRKFPKLGIYVVMFTHILITFAKFSAVFILFIIAFGFGFHLSVFEERKDEDSSTNAFETATRSMLKTTLGMLGEFEYDTVFNTYNKTQINIAWAVYVAYLVINCIILMNLLVGLAVDDIKGVQKKAALQRLAMMVDLTLDVEKALPISIQKKLVRLEESILPNVNKTWSVWSCWSDSPLVKPYEKSNNKLSKKERVQLKENVNNLQIRMKAMEAQNNRMEEMLNGIVKHLNIS
ncbi:transient receptor potential cation channel subfamily A member 1 homolog isoform X2 [Hydra vulgaris]|uniref:Transient receptor potential cation channel subfamily A member 1 homolog isoform X2 n=1 Tax=Hydra vulgaris TaxID=6087 RepID=A0ABM4BJM0_HYDVU